MRNSEIEKLSACRLETSIGPLFLESTETALVSVRFGAEPAGSSSRDEPLNAACRTVSGTMSAVSGPEPLRLAAQEIAAWLAGEIDQFSVPLDPRGTSFQMAVWAEVRKIGRGETRTYGQIARVLGNPNACRAVGSAVGKNPLPLIIPCHRVVGASGPGGFSGGMRIKRRLCELEGIRLS